jgi:hypothetical protein
MAKVPQDQFHVEKCIVFCEQVEALIVASNLKADERETSTGKPTSRLGYVDAVLIVAERQKIEPDLAALYLSPSIKQQMQLEWENRNLLPRTAKLPF